MRIHSGGLVYDFKLIPASNSSATSTYTDDDFTLNFHFRKLNGSQVQTDVKQSLRISRGSQELNQIMSDLLGEYEVPSQLKSDMSTHFKFNIDRLNRLRRSISEVAVNFTVESATPERAQAIRRQGEEEELNRIVMRMRRRRRFVDERVETKPATKAAVEGLERIRFISEDYEEEKECAVCLEMLVGGVELEVIKMPCSHLFHTHCILRWLDKNHFCPFCRFHLPS